MEAAWIFAAARPWHYWLAVVLVATGLTLVLSIAAGYYRQVLVFLMGPPDRGGPIARHMPGGTASPSPR